jgi:hypothetical protein
MILRACHDLSEGRDVLVVAFTQIEAVRIAKRIVAVAKALEIPCRNIRGSSPDDPGVMARAYGYEVQERATNWRLRVHVDHSAQAEKPFTPPDRSVVTR